ncbi:MAG: flagellin [Pseudomonadota bacterium]
MSQFSVGDLAQKFMLQRQGAALKESMTTLNQELATGQVSDVKAVLAGNVSYLADIEADLKTLSGYRVATTEAAQFAETIQAALTRMSTSAEEFGSNLLTVTSSAVNSVVEQMSVDAEAELANLVSALNTGSAGRSVFAGTATDQRAVADADDILADLRAATASATTVEDIWQAADAWFNDATGFADRGYTGGTTDIAPFQLVDDDTVAVRVRADDQVFRDLLKNVAVAAIANDASFALSADDKKELMTTAGHGVYTAQAQLTSTQAGVGSAQARIDEITTRNETRDTNLQFAKGALLQADPYETATELEAVQFQLQSLYTVTARMSDLSFVNFIR